MDDYRIFSMFTNRYNSLQLACFLQNIYNANENADCYNETWKSATSIYITEINLKYTVHHNDLIIEAYSVVYAEKFNSLQPNNDIWHNHWLTHCSQVNVTESH